MLCLLYHFQLLSGWILDITTFLNGEQAQSHIAMDSAQVVRAIFVK